MLNVVPIRDGLVPDSNTEVSFPFSLFPLPLQRSGTLLAAPEAPAARARRDVAERERVGVGPHAQ